jgi:hypothetical protein
VLWRGATSSVYDKPPQAFDLAITFLDLALQLVDFLRQG